MSELGVTVTVLLSVPVRPVPCPPPLEPLRTQVQLPRALEPAERLLGECAVDDTLDGVACAELRATPAD